MQKQPKPKQRKTLEISKETRKRGIRNQPQIINMQSLFINLQGKI